MAIAADPCPTLICAPTPRRQAALALNGTAGAQGSRKGPSSYTARFSTLTGRSLQQDGALALTGASAGRERAGSIERRFKAGACPFLRRRGAVPHAAIMMHF